MEWEPGRTASYTIIDWKPTESAPEDCRASRQDWPVLTEYDGLVSSGPGEGRGGVRAQGGNHSKKEKE